MTDSIGKTPDLTRDEEIALGIPVYHDPALPCPEYRHFNQKVPGKMIYGCRNCDVGWDYESRLTDNVFNGLKLFQWLKENGKKLPKGGDQFEVIPLTGGWPNGS